MNTRLPGNIQYTIFIYLFTFILTHSIKTHHTDKLVKLRNLNSQNIHTSYHIVVVNASLTTNAHYKAFKHDCQGRESIYTHTIVCLVTKTTHPNIKWPSKGFFVW